MNGQAPRILVLTGAGVSAESGLGTFRDVDGLWTKYDLNEVATPEGFARNPDLVYSFYNARRENLVKAEPNPAHYALARLQQALREAGGKLTMVTQNIDDLHEQAGAEDVIHMHGELLKSRCLSCGAIANWREALDASHPCAACGGQMRPHVVWFGEMPLQLDRIERELSSADLFVSIGTSGSVYPAAGYVAMASEMGLPCVELNLEPSENNYLFTEKCYGPASEVVPAWVKDLLDSIQESRS
ncbi:MAG: NAD-dependent deacylase [Pseudomonadota bacterium]